MSFAVFRDVPAQATRWLLNQPYLLLILTSLFWGGNVVVGRYVAGHVPPIMLAYIRWLGASLVMLPFAWPYLKRDWPVIRAHFPQMLLLSFTGISCYNTMAYYGLQYTEALNGLLMQSSIPLFVALFSLVLYRIRLSWVQFVGIILSLLGVVVIIARGDAELLKSIRFNPGDLWILAALFVFSFYTAAAMKRPKIHFLSFLEFIMLAGGLLLTPLAAWEVSTGYVMTFDTSTLMVLLYTVTLPSAVAYLFFNRGVELIGANRAAPFTHLMPVFGSVLAIAFLGESFRLFHAIGYALVIAGIVIATRKQ